MLTLSSVFGPSSTTLFHPYDEQYGSAIIRSYPERLSFKSGAADYETLENGARQPDQSLEYSPQEGSQHCRPRQSPSKDDDGHTPSFRDTGGSRQEQVQRAVNGTASDPVIYHLTNYADQASKMVRDGPAFSAQFLPKAPRPSPLQSNGNYLSTMTSPYDAIPHICSACFQEYSTFRHHQGRVGNHHGTFLSNNVSPHGSESFVLLWSSNNKKHK
jgi:hypothetical protein